MINGHSNVGKTTFTLWLMVAASLKHGWKWLVYSAENPTWANKMKLMQFCMDMPIKRMNHKELTTAYEWVNKHFIFVDNHQNYSYHDLLVFAEKMKNYQGIDGLLVDPYNALRIDLSANRGTSAPTSTTTRRRQSSLPSVTNTRLLCGSTLTHSPRRNDARGRRVACCSLR